ncbi:MAG: ABC transporter ATP-binding protein [Cyanophyceae cyanobacterium]
MKTSQSQPIPTAAHSPPELELVNITKRFGSLAAVDHVSLHLKPGTFHALIGENGAGKSTLVKCVMGFYRANAGEVIIGREARSISNPHDAHQYGIGMVYQHFTLVPAMTVAENLVLARSNIPGIIDWTAERARLATFLEQAPFQVNLDTPVEQLAAGEKQKIEILKQLYLESRLLILDEPTSVLTPQEADEVLGLLREMVDAGELSVLLITHKFREVMAYAQEVTVLRRGKVAGRGTVEELTTADLAQWMVGEKRSERQVEKSAQAPGDPVLRIENLYAERSNGVEAVKNISLTVCAGEILGIAGVSGNGQRELVEVLAGQRRPTAGRVQVNGEDYRATRSEMVRHRVFILPEEPLRNACVPRMSVAENLSLRTFDRPPQAVRGWLLNYQAMRQMAQKLVERFSIKTPSVDSPVMNLSGGNVQRTVLARELASGNTQVLIAANPCFGLDFAAVKTIHSQLIKARNQGVAVLLVSEDLDELLALSDRLVVMTDGALVYERSRDSADINTIGQRMAGH